MTERPRIAVIGLVGRSLFFEVPRFHAGGETIHATGFHEEWGGKGFNQAVAAARQGAGDTFNGVLAVRLAEGASLREACVAANEAAAKSVSVRYVMPSIPRRG